MFAKASTTVLLIAVYVTAVTCQLELVHVVFRHGQRTPADTYPTDPHINHSFAPVGWGQLTNQGKLDQYNQGMFLRERYGELLGDLYSPEVMIAHSTDVDRTKMSAQLELAGLWSPAESQKWHPSLNWQPVPLHSQPLSQDSLLLVRVPCNRYYEQLEHVLASDEVHAALAKYNAEELYTELTKHTGGPVATPEDVQSLYSTLKAEEGFNLTLPAWTSEFYPDRLEPLTAYSFVLNAYNTEMQKLKGGPLLKKILTDSRAKAASTLKPAGRKMFMYAGHDSTISNLLLALQVWDLQIPGYGIMAIVELHRIPEAGGHGIKVFLRNSTVHEPYPLTLPGCDHLCPLDQFVKLTQNVIPDDLKKNCVPSDPTYAPDSTPAP